jgi:DNA-binding transcriptional LysR family regulator
MNARNLNLLAIFDAIAATESVSAAAGKLSMSQPAVSHALNRLRDVTGDRLFIRTRHGMKLTPHAEQMVAGVRMVMAQSAKVLLRHGFDAATERRVFRLGASDYAAQTIVPRLIRHIGETAPHISLDIRAVGRDCLQALESGALDVSFWGASPPSGQFHHAVLFREHFEGVMSASHPLAKGKKRPRVTVAQYLRYPHVVVSLGDPGANAVEQALAARKLTRRVLASSFSFGGNLSSVAGSEALAAVPSRLCRENQFRGLATFPLPFRVPSYDYMLVWHERVASDPAIAWLRRNIRNCTARTPP